MLEKILAFFKKCFPENPQATFVDNPNAAYFHEDLFLQVEFLPRENWDNLKNENQGIAEFAEKHSDGNGYTDIYIREAKNQISIAEKNIRLDLVEALLTNFGMRRIEDVYYFYSSQTEKCENTIAYEIAGAYMFIVFENGTIKDFFIDGFRFHEKEDDKAKLLDILFEIGKGFSLILNDWDLTQIIDLEDKNEIKKYLNEEF